MLCMDKVVQRWKVVETGMFKTVDAIRSEFRQGTLLLNNSMLFTACEIRCNASSVWSRYEQWNFTAISLCCVRNESLVQSQWLCGLTYYQSLGYCAKMLGVPKAKIRSIESLPVHHCGFWVRTSANRICRWQYVNVLVVKRDHLSCLEVLCSQKTVSNDASTGILYYHTLQSVGFATDAATANVPKKGE